jgi:hypothetical protein
MPELAYYDVYDRNKMILQKVTIRVVHEHLPDYDRSNHGNRLYDGRYKIVRHGEEPVEDPYKKYSSAKEEEFAMRWILACYRLQCLAGR